MSGARPSQFKKGGGFLNNVDGTVLNYEFTTEFPNPNNKPKPKGLKKSDFNPLYCILTVQVDGADEPVTTTLFVGSADDFEIEEDGHTLTPSEEGYSLWASAEWSKLIASMVESKFPEENLPEDAINFEPIINERFRFAQQKDDEKTAKRGKRKDKKTGKEYDQQQLVAVAYYGSAEPVGKKTASKPTTKGKPQEDADDADLDKTVDEALLKVLAKRGGTATKAQLSDAQAQLLLKKQYPDNADEIRKRMYDDDYLSEAVDRDLITIDAKKKTISVA